MRSVLGKTPGRAGNEIRVIGTLPADKDWILYNNQRIQLRKVGNASEAGILTADTSNNVVLANLFPSKYVVLGAVDSTSSIQLYVSFVEYGTTQRGMLTFNQSSVINAPDALDIITTSGDITIAPSGELYVKSYERHIQVPASLTGNLANQPTQVDFFSTVSGLQFNQTTAKYAFCQWEIPDDWDGGNIYFEVDWFPDSGNKTSPAAVKWDLTYAPVAEGEVHGALPALTATVTNTATVAQYTSIHSRMTLTAASLAKQDHVYFRISRDVAATNDFNGTVTVSAFEIIYNSIQVPRGN